MAQNKRKGAPPRYDDAFRAGAVRLVLESGRAPKDVAAELGISIDSLRSWLQKATGSQTPVRDHAKDQRYRALEAENRALKKALAQKDDDIAVLRKSLGIVSRP